MFETVIVGADDSTTAREAVMVAAEIAQLHGGTLHIVTVYDPKSIQIQELPEEFRYSRLTSPADMLLEGLSRIVEQRVSSPWSMRRRVIRPTRSCESPSGKRQTWWLWGTKA